MLNRLKEHSKDIITDNPMISVVMIAYNVEPFIKEAIESVLNQRTNYSLELIIGEDCSTDNTRAIAIDYQKKYPHIIKTILHAKNLGLTPNCVATHNSCSGKYIALLDSDDYWTDDQKLQKQIDFLEKNMEFSGCAHQSFKIYDNNSSLPIPFGSNKDAVYTLDDTITHRKFHTSSFIYKKDIWDKTGGIPPEISSNERAIYPMVAIFGKIKYFKDSMCVYRLSGNGLSSRVNYKELETDLNMLAWLKNIDPNFPIKKFKSFIHLCVFTYGSVNMPIIPLVKHYILFSVLSFSYFPKNFGDLKWGFVFLTRKLCKFKQ